jgi:hypothetical protein
MLLKITYKGDFNRTEKFFKGVLDRKYALILEKYAQQGVAALASATPVDSGKTSESWGYKIRTYPGGMSISWTNSNVVDGVPIAIILQYGHATRNGGYVQGRDYINPAIRPIFDKITSDVWEEVTRL